MALNIIITIDLIFNFYFCGMIIRLAQSADVVSIMKLVAEVVPMMNASGNFQWDNTYPNPAVFEKDILNQDLWLTEFEGDIAGVAALTTVNEEEYAGVGWDINEPAVVVHRLAVSPHYQGKGIAGALMLQAEQVARDKGINVLRVDTNVVNKATNSLFPKLGYVFAGEIELKFKKDMKFSCYEKRI